MLIHAHARFCKRLAVKCRRPTHRTDRGIIGSCAGFRTPATTRRSARSTCRRPKSAKARSRGQLGTGRAASAMVDLMLAPISMMGGMPARRHLHVCAQARSGECRRHFGGRLERINERSAGGWMGLVERDRRRRGASASDEESRNACRRSWS
jgi:hypothetical protein